MSKGIGNRKVAIETQSATDRMSEAMVTYHPASGPQFVYWLTVLSPNCEVTAPLKMRHGPSEQDRVLRSSLNPWVTPRKPRSAMMLEAKMPRARAPNIQRKDDIPHDLM